MPELAGQPRVSVLMAAYEAERYVEEAVRSILDQTFADFELLILDDGSTDRTLEVIRAIADPRVIAVSRPNRGCAAARNELLRMSRAEYVAVMDADDIAMPHRLEHQVRYLDDHPEVGAVSAWAELFDENGVIVIDRDPVEDESIRNRIRVTGSMFDGALMVRRDVLLAVGGYDERAWWNDWEVSLRLAGATRLHNLPEVLIRYRRHPSAMQESTSRLARRKDKFRRRLQAARVLGWRPRSIVDVGGPAAAVAVYSVLDPILAKLRDRQEGDPSVAGDV